MILEKQGSRSSDLGDTVPPVPGEFFQLSANTKDSKRKAGCHLTDFLDPRSLASPLSQVVELSSSDSTFSNALNTLDDWRIQGENPLDPISERDFSNRKR